MSQNLIATEECDLIYQVSLKGGKVVMKYGTFEICRADSSQSQNFGVKTYPFFQCSSTLVISASDTNTPYSCSIAFEIKNRNTGITLLQTIFSFANPDKTASGKLDYVELPITINKAGQ